MGGSDDAGRLGSRGAEEGDQEGLRGVGFADGSSAFEGGVHTVDQVDHFYASPGFGIVIVGCMPQLLGLDKCVRHSPKFDHAIKFSSLQGRRIGVEVTAGNATLALRCVLHFAVLEEPCQRRPVLCSLPIQRCFVNQWMKESVIGRRYSPPQAGLTWSISLTRGQMSCLLE